MNVESRWAALDWWRGSVGWRLWTSRASRCAAPTRSRPSDRCLRGYGALRIGGLLVIGHGGGIGQMRPVSMSAAAGV